MKARTGYLAVAVIVATSAFALSRAAGAETAPRPFDAGTIVDMIRNEPVVLTGDELGHYRQQLQACWTKPSDNAPQAIAIHVQYNADGTLRGEPVLEQPANSAAYRAAAAAVVAAVKKCQPVSLPPHKYQLWKSMQLQFDTANWQ